MQASQNEDGQTNLRTVACLAQSFNEIQSPPPWSAGQLQGESTRKRHNEVSTQCTHVSPHKSTQMFCTAAQQQRPTILANSAPRSSPNYVGHLLVEWFCDNFQYTPYEQRLSASVRRAQQNRDSPQNSRISEFMSMPVPRPSQHRPKFPALCLPPHDTANTDHADSQQSFLSVFITCEKRSLLLGGTW